MYDIMLQYPDPLRIDVSKAVPRSLSVLSPWVTWADDDRPLRYQYFGDLQIPIEPKRVYSLYP